MAKTITLDYEEFEAIKEKANLNQSTIDEQVNERLNTCLKMAEYSCTRQYKYEIDEYKSIIQKIKKRCKTEKNIFGYIKVESILKIIKEK